MQKQRRYSVYGLCVQTDYQFSTPMASESFESEPTLVFSCELARSERMPSADNCFFSSAERNRYGESLVELYVKQGGVLMRFPRIAEFHLYPGEIVCRLYNPDWGYMVELCLLGHVLAYYLELNGVIALHAGAVGIGGQAVLFAADRTGGKSTLVASLVQAGFPLLADDIAALECGNEKVKCRPSFPQLKLTPDQVDRFTKTADRYPLVHPEFQKLNVPADRVGPVAAVGLPVACLYLLERQACLAEPFAEVEIELFQPGEATIKLVRHSFLAQGIDKMCPRHRLADTRWGNDGRDESPFASKRLQRLAGISSTVCVKRLRYSSGYNMLPVVHQAILADLS